MKCPTCGTGNLVAARRSMPYTYKGEKTVIKAVRGEYCDNPKCHEVVMDMGESTRTAREMLAFNKKVNATLTPIELLAQVRKKLDLTQQQAAKIFGGGPNAFSRYESGKTKPPVALVKLFHVLRRHPDLYEELVEVADSTIVSKVVAAKRRRPTSARTARA
jgi:HTH-type transcriptional regulator / antitoxin MqsA